MDVKTVAVAATPQVLLQQAKADQQNNLLQGLCSLLPFTACFLVAVQFAQTAYRVRHGAEGTAFVLAAYAMLALLFYCVGVYENAVVPGATQTRRRLKMSVWALSMALTGNLSAPGITPLIINWLLAVHIAICAICFALLAGSAESGKMRGKSGSSVSEATMDGKGVAAAGEQQQTKADPRNSLLRRLCSLLPFLACILVAIQFAQTVYDGRHDTGYMVCVLAAYAMLAPLFYCIGKYERIVNTDFPGAGQNGKRLKMTLWALSTALIVTSSAGTTPSMIINWAVALLIAMSATCSLLISGSREKGIKV